MPVGEGGKRVRITGRIRSLACQGNIALQNEQGAMAKGREVPFLGNYGLHYSSSSSETITLNVTSSTGLSFALRSTAVIASTISIPSVTFPKTVCFPSSHGVPSLR